MADTSYDYYDNFRRHKVTGIWEEWIQELNSWQIVFTEEFT